MEILKDGFVEGSNFYNMCTIVEEIAEKVRELTRTVKGLKQGTGIKRKGVEQQVDLTQQRRLTNSVRKPLKNWLLIILLES